MSTTPENSEVNRTCWGVKRPVLLQRQVQLKRQPVHMYVSKTPESDNLFSPRTNMSGFTLKYNEEHLLMINMLPCIRQAVVEKDVPVKIDTEQKTSSQVAFMVRVMLRNTEVAVGPDTPLSLLLNMGCLHVETLMLSSDQVYHLLYPEEQE